MLHKDGVKILLKYSVQGGGEGMKVLKIFGDGEGFGEGAIGKLKGVNQITTMWGESQPDNNSGHLWRGEPKNRSGRNTSRAFIHLPCQSGISLKVEWAARSMEARKKAER